MQRAARRAPVPALLEEVSKPVGKHSETQLQREDEGEKHVERLQRTAAAGDRAVGAGEVVRQLHLRHIGAEILHVRTAPHRTAPRVSLLNGGED